MSRYKILVATVCEVIISLWAVAFYFWLELF